MNATIGRLLILTATVSSVGAPLASAQPACGRTIKADVVALDQAFYNNRLGAFQAGGMIFALRRDVVPVYGTGPLAAGKVMLRPDKRPRPMVLRMNVDDCLEVRFQNLLSPTPSVFNPSLSTQQYPVRVPGSTYSPNKNARVAQEAQSTFTDSAGQPATRLAGVHVMGMELVKAETPPGTPAAGSAAEGSWVGANDVAPVDPQVRASGLVSPGRNIVYTFTAKAEGAYLLYSTAADVGDPLSFGGQLMQGLFGAVTVQPKTAEWYRSQVTKADLDLATTGKTADGHPIIDYDKVYPPTHPRKGQPILKMLDAGSNIVYSDLTAIITGPKHGRFDCADCPDFKANPSYPDRSQPYREFAIHYHDDFVTTQAFSPFSTPGPTPIDDLTFTLRGGRDFFAINYGIGGIGAEVWANRIKVGPMHDCATCRFEEFFLSSWAVGDPAMIVDIPANAINPATGQIRPGPKATKALYPDDPSNVYHSYMGDHVKFQILHAGTNITHVHHLHAHQWLHTPNDDTSSYRDSQMISPGGSYTLDHTYSGSGNKNKTVGDAIFHCHFYPHFAQGMWSLWRVHDVFEGGTALDYQKRPLPGWNRSLPDGEISNGTPIPALVPLPTLPMAPIPAKVRLTSVDVPGVTGRAGFRSQVDMADPNIANGPGFPFFVPGVAGQRAPHPPLDFAPDDADAANPFLNGGLPRFLALKETSPTCTGQTTGCLYEKHNRWDFSKFNDSLKAVRLDEQGTAVEKIAMAYHAKRRHDTFFPDGSPATGASAFVLNGRPPINGAPYADPAVLLDGTPVCPENKPPCLMRYKAADIELDVVLNKKGQHFPQARMTSLWGDVKDTLTGKRAPEPFFFRANSTQVIEYWLANLVPNYYELDNFQVRTPTDILGQHIHLVKFDVTSSDGAGNGFNYEDGTLSPDEVREVIENINKGGGLFPSLDFTPGSAEHLTPKTIPYFGDNGGKWLGAQATIQRWYADPVTSNGGVDRTLRTIFTHDHFGPSTHQQVGLYAGLLVEPDGSRWQEPVTGTFLGTGLGRPVGANGQTIDDGGPTSWQANILTASAKDSYREFALEFQDRQLGYKSSSLSPAQRKPYVRYQARNPACGQFWGWADESTKALTPPLATSPCPPNIPTPTPSIVTLTFDTGTYSLNYRNEPPPFRLNPEHGTQTSPEQTDLSHVFRSMTRIDPAMNVQPTGKINPLCPGTECFNFPPVQFGVGPTDPYTPMLRAYEGDKVQIRTLVGAHMSPHYFTVHGINWLFEPTDFDAADNTSGYRGTQGMGISEHYEALFTLPRTNAESGAADYLYSSSSDATGLANGNWGIMRAYRAKQPTPGLVPLPNNEPPATIAAAPAAPAVCPAAAPVKAFSLVAARAIDVLGGPLVYNARGKAGAGGSKQIVNPKALAYFLASDLDGSGKLLPGTPVEPAILRANAGDCITVSIENRLPADVGTDRISTSLNIPIRTSSAVGLHPQLVAFDVTRSNGVNVGQNPVFTIASGASQTYTWYAGRIEGGAGAPNYIPVEFGSIPLTPSDPLMQHPYGLLGALIIEPAGTSWRTDEHSRASASVCTGNTSCASGDLLYREFVAILQDDVAGLAFTAPPVVGTHISGDVLNGKPTWTMNGQALPAGGVKLAPGDTVTFDILNGTHGLLFASEAQAKQVFDIDGSPDKAKFQTFANQCTQANSYGTLPQSSGQIAKITAKQPFTLSPLNYECSQHCANMKGSFVLNTGGPTPPAPAPADAPTLSTPDDYTRAVNYRTEPLDYRYSTAEWLANDPATSPIGIARALSNSLVLADPETPIFVATANTPVRFRVVHPAGLNEQVFVLHGHKWQEEPYVNGSREIGSNAKSQSQGSRDGVGPNVAFDAVIDKAGGAGAVAGDYLYRTFIGNTFQPGLWGLFRVAAPTEDVVTITRFSNPKETRGQVLIAGTTTVDPGTGKRAATVTIFDTTAGAMKELGQADVDKLSGRWPKADGPFKAPATVRSILVRSAGNGRATAGGYIGETPIETRAAPAAGSGPAAAAAPPGGAPPPPPPPRRRARAAQEDELSLFMAVPKQPLLIQATRGAAEPVIMSDPSRFDRATRVVTLRRGETVSFAVRDEREEAAGRAYELTFPSRAQAEAAFEFGTPGAPMQVSGAGLTTGQLQAPGVVATLLVRAAAAPGTRIPVVGIVDGQRIEATFVIEP